MIELYKCPSSDEYAQLKSHAFIDWYQFWQYYLCEDIFKDQI